MTLCKAVKQSKGKVSFDIAIQKLTSKTKMNADPDRHTEMQVRRNDIRRFLQKKDSQPVVLVETDLNGTNIIVININYCCDSNIPVLCYPNFLCHDPKLNI